MSPALSSVDLLGSNVQHHRDTAHKLAALDHGQGSEADELLPATPGSHLSIPILVQHPAISPRIAKSLGSSSVPCICWRSGVPTLVSIFTLHLHSLKLLGLDRSSMAMVRLLIDDRPSMPTTASILALLGPAKHAQMSLQYLRRGY